MIGFTEKDKSNKIMGGLYNGISKIYAIYKGHDQKTICLIASCSLES
jgi:hypothetical protein